MTSQASLVGTYLRARRDITRPEDVGLVRGQNRRVSGLRREEVAALAGISAEYYLRLEQGRDHRPSDQVLSALGRALALDEHARHYLHTLARPKVARPRSLPPASTDPALRRLLERHAGMPSFIMNSTLHVVASNPLAAALGASMRPGANRLLRMFTDVDRNAYPDWPTRAADMVAVLRMRADPNDPSLQALVGQLSIQDAEFAAIWARHDVQVSTFGTCFEVVPPFGTMQFEWQDLVIPGHDGLTMTTLFAPAGSRGAAVLAYLAERSPAAGEVADSNRRVS
jgi:transcriptional regulator with XRE-family HTH domain